MIDSSTGALGAGRVTKGLVVREPWIDLILSGKKTWEMRSAATSFRGWFGLIRKGSGTVAGVARLRNVGARLAVEEMVATSDKHRIPEAAVARGKSTGGPFPGCLPMPVR